jgi:uncharacterized membrane protein
LREKLQPSATFATILIERIYDTVTVVTAFCTLLVCSLNCRQIRLPRGKKSAAQKTFGTLLLSGIVTGVFHTCFYFGLKLAQF